MQFKSQLKIVNKLFSFSLSFLPNHLPPSLPFNRFNYKIGDVFRELMGCTRPGYIARTDFANGGNAKGKCNIL